MFIDQIFRITDLNTIEVTFFKTLGSRYFLSLRICPEVFANTHGEVKALSSTDSWVYNKLRTYLSVLSSL